MLICKWRTQWPRFQLCDGVLNGCPELCSCNDGAGRCAQTCQNNLINAMNEFPALSTLVQVIQQAGLTDRINKTDNVTFVAPNNNAFNVSNVLTFANVTDKDNNRAGSILLYHIITVAAVITGKLVNGQSLPTSLEGRNLTISKTSNPIEKFMQRT